MMKLIVTLKVMEQKTANQPQPDREASSTLDELASRQGVKPILNFEALLGNSSPEDESSEEFAAMLRTWRQEGSHLSHQQ